MLFQFRILFFDRNEALKIPRANLEGWRGIFGGTHAKNRTWELVLEEPAKESTIMGTLDSAAGVASPASLSDEQSARATVSGRRTIMVFLGVALTSYRALVQRRPTPPLLPRKTIFGRNGYMVFNL